MKRGKYKRTKEHREKMSKVQKGKKPSEETKKKMSRTHKKIGNKPPIQKGKNHWNWKGGISSIRNRLYNHYKYRQWRSDVFTRDNFICQKCGQRGKNLEAHHKKELSQIIKENKIKNIEEALSCEEIWNINNGETLCKKCHRKTFDFYGNQYINKK